MSNYSAETGGQTHRLAANKELEALTLRAAGARAALRELAGRTTLGQKEMELLLGLFQEPGESEEAFALHLVEKERAAQQVAERLARAEANLLELEAQLREKEHSLARSAERMARLEQKERTASAALANAGNSRSWRVAQALRRARLRLLPAGSIRERLARLGVRTVRTWRGEGFLAVVRKGLGKVLRKLRRLARACGTRLHLLKPDLPVIPPPLVQSAIPANMASLPLLPFGSMSPAAHDGAVRPSGEVPRLHIDAFQQLDERSYYVKGWIWGEGSQKVQVAALAPGGGRTQLHDLYRYPRSDIFEHFDVALQDRGDLQPAFIGFFQTADPAGLSSGWTLECRGDHGAGTCPAPASSRDLLHLRNCVLADLQLRGGDRDLLLRRHVAPALQRLQQRLAKPDVVRVEQYGKPPPAPLASLVVPLYRRIDFLEHQLAQFVHDPEVRRADVIYVLDSPELADVLHERALQLSRLYPVPFRVVYLRHNVGYAGANTAGIDLARGCLLVLLNSDVLPDRPGWLNQMAAFYLKTPRLGALGPKLVYEDETLQHAGMYFARQVGSAVWENAHYYKGLHRHFPPSNQTRKVPAVSGACMMIKRDRYREVGGLQNLYIQGDYEDSDLCLRLHEKGHDHWYLADCALYHLEGQSYPGALRNLTYQYNSWLQTHLWGPRIEAIMASFAANPSEQLSRRAA